MNTVVWFFIVYSVTFGTQLPVGKSKAYHFGTQVKCEQILKQTKTRLHKMQIESKEATLRFWNKKCSAVKVELDLGKV